jgi:O-antigen/teichoic acid export membrane protein
VSETALNKIYRDLFKHSGIYGLGYVLSRLTSFLLLPVYTRFLSPADYGCIAILDLTNALLAIVLGSGLQWATTRLHFAAADERGRAEVWWTGLSLLSGAATALLVPAFVLRHLLADLTLGAEETNGAYFFALALPTLGLNSVAVLLEGYLRARGWAGTFFLISVGRFVFNGTLNVALLALFQMGVAGILIGNLATGVVVTAVLLALFGRHCGRYRFSPARGRELWAYGLPLVATGMMALLMSQADRYFLRAYGSLSDAGLYALAWALGQGINTLILLPFSMSWDPVKFQIATRPNARKVYADVFQVFMAVLLLIQLAFALLAYPLLAVMVGTRYLAAAELVPLISLAYLFFSATDFLGLPAALHGQTAKLIPASLAALAVNLAGNWLLIPAYGMVGAGAALVLTFAVRAAVTHASGLAIERIGFRLGSVLALLAAAVAVYAGVRWLRSSSLPAWVPYGVGGAAWLALAAVSLGVPAARFLASSGGVGKQPKPCAGQDAVSPEPVGQDLFGVAG